LISFAFQIMNAKIHIPYHSALSSYITAIWETIPPGISHEVILPKGMVELVFNLSDPMMGILPHQSIASNAPHCFLQGLNTHVVQVEYSGDQHLFGINLQTHMVKSLLGILPSECKNTIIDLTLINPFFQEVWYQLMEADGFEERVTIIEKTFPILDQVKCPRTHYFCSIFSNPMLEAPASVDELTKDICYSARQLNRKSQSLFGLSTEELLIHKKFRTAVSLMHDDTKALTSIAHEAGFYDQAHFCRVFKNYTGLNAKDYRLKKSNLPFHIFS
jgi:AraC-like DNA-binding protein